MFYGKYKIADTVVEIYSLYETVQKMCKDYTSDEESEIVISIAQNDIDFEKKNDEVYPDDYLETLAVYRKLAQNLIEKDIILFHSSAVCVGNEAYVFAAKSGTGKSTHTALWQKEIENAVIINDDKPLIKISEKSASVFGTPWNGKHNIGNNIFCNLKAICFIERNEENIIEEISFKQAYPKIISHTFQPEEEKNIIKLLQLIDRLKFCKFYVLKCNQKPESAHVAYCKMKG